jgi:hypothetical protein
VCRHAAAASGVAAAAWMGSYDRGCQQADASSIAVLVCACKARPCISGRVVFCALGPQVTLTPGVFCCALGVTWFVVSRAWSAVLWEPAAVLVCLPRDSGWRADLNCMSCPPNTLWHGLPCEFPCAVLESSCCMCMAVGRWCARSCAATARSALPLLLLLLLAHPQPQCGRLHCMLYVLQVEADCSRAAELCLVPSHLANESRTFDVHVSGPGCVYRDWMYHQCATSIMVCKDQLSTS